MSAQTRPAGDSGFSLMEVVVAMSILMVGLLGLAQVFYFGMAIVSTSSNQLIAREKAREAIESVHTARDTRVITWAQIRNAATPVCPAAWGANLVPGPGGGRFTTAEHPLLAAGPDGLVATNDDTGSEMTPGPDNTLGTADDIPLVGFRRQIAICDIQGNANLRLIAVTIRYNGSAAVGNQQRTYTLITYISSFS
jgi:prepilin-type N-terminal cleavage/methylation domain-containing protein